MHGDETQMDRNVAFDNAFRKAREEHRRKAEREAARVERETRQRDMGVGYLIWAARREASLSQSALARRLGTSRQAIGRWERGEQLPTVHTLERVAAETGLELVIGLRRPDSATGEFVALGETLDEGRMTELYLFVDAHYRVYLPPTKWREKLRAEGYRL